MPRASAQRGDYTGIQRQKAAAEKADELAKRQTEIGMANDVDIVIEQEGIFDPVSGQLIEMPPEAQSKIDRIETQTIEVEEDPIYDPQNQPLGDPMRPFEDLEIKQKPKPVRPNAMEVMDLGEDPEVTEPEYRVMRVNSDIEEMTYGAGNTMTFVRGRRYRVPSHLYEWLDSRGVIYH